MYKYFDGPRDPGTEIKSAPTEASNPTPTILY
jgi:hypothetical protein